MHDRVERIESIKAGSLGGLAAGMSYCPIVAVDKLVLSRFDRLPQLSDGASIVSLGLEAAIFITGGCLFGIAYRYIIRTDRNNHLNSGAVLAFGLVRGLAQVDIDTFDSTQIWLNGFIVAKSILLFTIARYTLDLALALRWISPFKSS